MRLPKDKAVIVERHNKAVYDCGDTIVKVFNATKPAADVFHEAENIARAEQAGINVPQVVEVSKAGVGWAVSTRKVEGKTLRQMMSEEPERVDEFLEQLVALELDVHAHRNPLLRRQKDKLARMINSIPDVLGDATRYDLLMRLDGMKAHDKVCHGDFVPSNIIVPDDGTAPVIVDWAHACQGNGGADCAITYLHLIMGGEAELAERYVNLYCERQGCDRDYINGWTSIVAAAELARGRVHETDFLMTWVDVYDGM